MVTIVGFENTKELVDEIGVNLGKEPVILKKSTFLSGEIEVNVTKITNPVILIAATVTNDDWIALFLLLEALKNTKVHLILSYMGYARQHYMFSNKPSSFNLFLNLLDYFELDGITFIDCHSEPIMKTSFSHLSALPLFVQDIAEKYSHQNLTFVSPDMGRIKIVQSAMANLNCNDLAICIKIRTAEGVNCANLLGNVSGKLCILIDDMIDSGETLLKCTELLMHLGAKKIMAYVTHSLSSINSLDRLIENGISRLVLTNTIFNRDPGSKRIECLSISPILTAYINNEVLPLWKIM